MNYLEVILIITLMLLLKCEFGWSKAKPKLQLKSKFNSISLTWALVEIRRVTPAPRCIFAYYYLPARPPGRPRAEL